MVITTFTDRGDYTTPFLRSIRRREPKHNDIEIIIIDNGSRNPYPLGSDYKPIRFNDPVCWAKMLNTGVEASCGDWLMLLNDDVLCQGEFVDLIESIDKNSVVGPQMRHKNPSWGAGVQINYLYAWLLAMQRDVFDKIGGFDEWYKLAGVDDIDFCWRAEQKGFALSAVDLPFIHLEPHRREKWDGYVEQMKKSKEYFIRKVKNNGK
jgi:GT2 family glycosyltransferase